MCCLEVSHDLYGRPIIGYNHTLTPQEAEEISTITEKEADRLLEADLQTLVFQ